MLVSFMDSQEVVDPKNSIESGSDILEESVGFLHLPAFVESQEEESVCVVAALVESVSLPDQDEGFFVEVIAVVVESSCLQVFE